MKLDARRFALIVAAEEDTARIVESAFQKQGRARDLELLHSRLRRRLEQLESALTESPMTPEDALDILTPLVFLCDERVQKALSRELGGNGEGVIWPLLQEPLVQENDGGDQFYDNVDALCSQNSSNELLVATYLHCLVAGFEGRYFEEPDAIREVKKRLEARLPRSPDPAAKQADPAAPTARPRWFYLAVGLGVVVVGHGVLALVSLLW